MSNIQQTVLDNGLRIITDSMEGIASVTVGVWVDVGSRNESATMNGMTHLIEHMLFKGTKSRSARMIIEQIENVGGLLNAYTTREHTVYYAKLLGEDLPLAVDLIGDMLQNSIFDESELAREKEVILQEIAQAYDTPDDILFDFFQQTAYPNQTLGRPIAGTSSTLSALDKNTLLQYLQTYYTKNAMVLAAAGCVTHDHLVELATKTFTSLTPLKQPKPPENASYHGGDYRESRTLQQVHLLIGLQGVNLHDEDLYPMMVLSTLFGGGMSSRLFQEIRENRGLAYSIYSFLNSYQDTGVFGIYAGTGVKQLPELITALCEQIVLVSDTLQEDEVQRARTQLKAELLMGLESSTLRCERLGQNLLNFKRVIPVEEIVSKVESVDGGSVRKVIQRLRRSVPTIAAIGPIDDLEKYDRLVERITQT